MTSSSARPCTRRSTPTARSRCSSRTAASAAATTTPTCTSAWRSAQLVGEVGEDLGPVLRDEDEVLQAHAAVALAVRPGLDGEDVTGDQHVGAAAEAGRLVDLEADAVAEAVEEALVQ